MSIKEGSNELPSTFRVVPRIDPKKLPFMIIEILVTTNLLFERCTGVKELFKLKPEAIAKILKPWEDDKDFLFKIGSIAMCFDTEIDSLRSLLQTPPDPEWGSIILVMKWLEQEGQNPQMIKVWRDIVNIRNATVPIHGLKTTIVDLYKSYGQTLPYINFQELWIRILEELLASLERFCQFLNSRIYSQP